MMMMNRLRFSLRPVSRLYYATSEHTRTLSSRAASKASATNHPPKTALVLGSSGALGSSVSHYLSREMGMQVIGADIFELPTDLDLGWELDAFVQLPEKATISELSVALYEGLHRVLDESDLQTAHMHKHGGLLDAIVCANGGWQGDPPTPFPVRDDDHDKSQQHIYEAAAVLEHMVSVNLNPVLAASLCTQYCCTPGALVVVMGATAALSPTPGMMGYGVSKAAVHHVVQTLGSLSPRGMSKIQKGTRHKTNPHFPTVVGILPSTLDTPGNRRAMPDADTRKWTHPTDISAQIGTWLAQPSLRPAAGSLVKVQSDGEGKAIFELVR
uniref:NAD-dependent epimerase/dehydratase domain-containing protein n=1 Tax=Amphora coffeiformis TaxID=265554 RepID=A0A7S3L507_9STRA|mmetsp:Transcript_4668/g.8899  ORF Transcript_4668/g.8899 Transcript_4668/m.8899 type:complete len:327 (+) Transcript_4668:105-1085(+)|eukprot:scaffold38516_cov176-Amphora_coffeaeformis.AAC.1